MAFDNRGAIYFTLTQVNTNNQIMGLYLSWLAGKLDNETPGWRDNSVLLLDGASYHTSSETRSVM